MNKLQEMIATLEADGDRGEMNDRLLENKSMVVSTNLTIDEIGQRYSPQIRSRLQGSFQLLPFVGQDIRVLRNRGY